MDWNKAKNLIIFLLVLVNVFLLGNMAYLAYKKEAASRTAVTELTAYLASRGITLDEDTVPRENPGRTVLVLEYEEKLTAAAARVLLEDSALSAGENGVYSNGAGEISLKPGGYVEARLAGEMDAKEFLRLLAKSGINLRDTGETADTIQFQAVFEELPVFNCTVTAGREEQGWNLSGRICMGNALRTDSGAERDIEGLLVGVTQRLALRGTTQIYQIEAGWVAGSISNVGLRLTPVYKLTADSDDFYINAVDGTLLSVE